MGNSGSLPTEPLQWAQRFHLTHLKVWLEEGEALRLWQQHAAPLITARSFRGSDREFDRAASAPGPSVPAVPPPQSQLLRTDVSPLIVATVDRLVEQFVGENATELIQAQRVLGSQRFESELRALKGCLYRTLMAPRVVQQMLQACGYQAPDESSRAASDAGPGPVPAAPSPPSEGSITLEGYLDGVTAGVSLKKSGLWLWCNYNKVKGKYGVRVPRPPAGPPPVDQPMRPHAASESRPRPPPPPGPPPNRAIPPAPASLEQPRSASEANPILAAIQRQQTTVRVTPGLSPPLRPAAPPRPAPSVPLKRRNSLPQISSGQRPSPSSTTHLPTAAFPKPYPHPSALRPSPSMPASSAERDYDSDEDVEFAAVVVDAPEVKADPAAPTGPSSSRSSRPHLEFLDLHSFHAVRLTNTLRATSSAVPSDLEHCAAEAATQPSPALPTSTSPQLSSVGLAIDSDPLFLQPSVPVSAEEVSQPVDATPSVEQEEPCIPVPTDSAAPPTVQDSSNPPQAALADSSAEPTTAELEGPAPQGPDGPEPTLEIAPFQQTTTDILDVLSAQVPATQHSATVAPRDPAIGLTPPEPASSTQEPVSSTPEPPLSTQEPADPQTIQEPSDFQAALESADSGTHEFAFSVGPATTQTAETGPRTSPPEDRQSEPLSPKPVEPVPQSLGEDTSSVHQTAPQTASLLIDQPSISGPTDPTVASTSDQLSEAPPSGGPDAIEPNLQLEVETKDSIAPSIQREVDFQPADAPEPPPTAVPSPLDGVPSALDSDGTAPQDDEQDEVPAAPGAADANSKAGATLSKSAKQRQKRKQKGKRR